MNKTEKGYSKMGLSRCRWCYEKNVKKVFTTEKLPTYIWPSKKEDPLYQEGELYLCETCGHLQLQDMTDEFISSLYENYVFIQDIPTIHERRIKFLQTHIGDSIRKDLKSLDVGGGVNSIFFQLPQSKLETTIVDFNVCDKSKEMVDHFIEGDFVQYPFKNKKFDLIFSYHCAEHLNNPRPALEKISELLEEDGFLIIEVPDIEAVVEKRPYYSVFHEHINCFHFEFFHYAFTSLGLEYIASERENFCMHFIFKKSSSKPVLPAPPVKKARQIVESYKENIQKTTQKINQLLGPYKNKKIGLYGAGGSTNLFIANYPILNELCSVCFDRDTLKHGLAIGKNRMEILPPNKIDEYSLDYLLFVYKDIFEIMKTKTKTKCIDLSTCF